MKETLQITLRKNRRSEDLIQIARKTKGENISYSYGQSNPPLPEEAIFSEAELFEISWFDQMVKFFHEHQDANATDLERYRLFMPDNFYQAIYELHKKCQEHKIDYRPVDSLLKSIINKIKATEKSLYEKTGITSNVLKDIHFKTLAENSEKHNSSALLLFKKFIEIPDFYNQFKQIATNDYKKNPNIKIGHFKGYAQGHALPSKWICACAIDVIAQSESPFTILNSEELIELWIKPKLRSGFELSQLLSRLKEINSSPEFIKSVEEASARFL
ncbi:hypothetical protein [Legionella saoudiensis]|uniref:hypothetical protein n=1 Tax=Legionella saoudiensis TaxID=1750561 RepID=UPI000730AA9C|nr:hypothetical protein [Legionella saoudiensis]